MFWQLCVGVDTDSQKLGKAEAVSPSKATTVIHTRAAVVIAVREMGQVLSLSMEAKHMLKTLISMVCRFISINRLL